MTITIRVCLLIDAIIDLKVVSRLAPPLVLLKSMGDANHSPSGRLYAYLHSRDFSFRTAILWDGG